MILAVALRAAEAMNCAMDGLVASPAPAPSRSERRPAPDQVRYLTDPLMARRSHLLSHRFELP